MRRRFGYRRIGLLLERTGMSMKHTKLNRIYREEGLSVRRRHGCKRACGTRAPMPVAEYPNSRWSLDFVSDSIDDARRKLALWRYDYNTVGPHSSLKNLTSQLERQTLEQSEGSTSDTLASDAEPEFQNQTCRFSL